MNREIKFRGKCVPNSMYAGEWVTGVYVPIEGKVVSINEGLIVRSSENSSITFHVVSDTVGQFTGLKDKNGKEIYEGDLISISNVRGDYVVRYDSMNCCYALFRLHAGFVMGWNFADFLKEAQKDRYEVIGNIFDRRTKNE